MDAADLMRLTNRCLDVMQEEVVRFGGYPIKRIGDCLMAVFGAPEVIENAPHAAVNAAIEMRTRVLRFAEQEKLELNIHTGVHTGKVAVGIQAARPLDREDDAREEYWREDEDAGA